LNVNSKTEVVADMFAKLIKRVLETRQSDPKAALRVFNIFD